MSRKHQARALSLGILLGAALTISTRALVLSPFGRHVQRWLWYTDARHTHPGIYSWKTLA